jgi:sugar phosphate isomerase/epimerase
MRIAERHLNRRDFLSLAAGVAATSLVGCRATAQQQVVPVGVQLYCVRHELPDDMPGVLARLAGMGYQGVEFADYFGRSAQELRTMLDENGLRACGTHIYMADMQGDRLEETVEFNQILGNEYLIVRWLNENQRDSREAFMRTVDEFNEIADRLRPHHMRVGYHNHDYIFQTFDGEMLWNILADHTDPDVVLQLDTGHAAGIGQDPVELLRRNPGRTATMHVKPYSAAQREAFIGDDDLDWPNIFNVAESTGGIEWYIIEYEIEGVPPLEALEANLARFREMRA